MLASLSVLYFFFYFSPLIFLCRADDGVKLWDLFTLIKMEITVDKCEGCTIAREYKETSYYEVKDKVVPQKWEASLPSFSGATKAPQAPDSPLRSSEGPQDPDNKVLKTSVPPYDESNAWSLYGNRMSCFLVLILYIVFVSSL